jgi:Dyp-type peroxidase family
MPAPVRLLATFIRVPTLRAVVADVREEQYRLSPSDRPQAATSAPLCQKSRISTARLTTGQLREWNSQRLTNTDSWSLCVASPSSIVGDEVKTMTPKVEETLAPELAAVVDTETPIRETPAASPLRSGPDPAFPDASNEPVLAIENIQGNIITGFNKNFQTLLLLRIVDGQVPQFKRWLKSLIPFIATAAEVIAFNRLFKATRQRRGVEGTVKATWVNIALSFNALKKLANDANQFNDQAFKQGLRARSKDLGDPTGSAPEGSPHNWVIGGPGNEADVILIIASDDEDDLTAEVTRVENSIFAFRVNGQPARSGVQVLFKQQGAVLPGSLAGHEHFGFLDGVSQPGLRGRLSDEPTDVLTPRQNPNDRDQGKPGQDLLWPGEFIFGYPGQDPKANEVSDEGPVAQAHPQWAKDGSFLVFRRLRQDVAGLHGFLHENGDQFNIGPDFVGAKLVGRWPTGAPVLRAKCDDDALLAADDCANNHFEFEESVELIEPQDKESPIDCSDDQFPRPPADADGLVCPLSAHIRKAYPRDDEPPGEVPTQTHRLLRRGIPYGPPSSSTPHAPLADDVDRGLLFLAYQTSVVEQFEFVIRNWVNNPNFKRNGVGHDPIIGQNNKQGEHRERTFKITFDGPPDCDQQSEVLTTRADWVIPTGGGYFFAPSLSALNQQLTA